MQAPAGFRAHQHNIAGTRLTVFCRNINAEDDFALDPCFFDADYTVATSTAQSKVLTCAWCMAGCELQTSCVLGVTPLGAAIRELCSVQQAFGMWADCYSFAAFHSAFLDC